LINGSVKSNFIMLVKRKIWFCHVGLKKDLIFICWIIVLMIRNVLFWTLIWFRFGRIIVIFVDLWFWKKENFFMVTVNYVLLGVYTENYVVGLWKWNRLLVLGSLVQDQFPFQLREEIFHPLLLNQEDVGFKLYAR
jgi:hypothetical protein